MAGPLIESDCQRTGTDDEPNRRQARRRAAWRWRASSAPGSIRRRCPAIGTDNRAAVSIASSVSALVCDSRVVAAGSVGFVWEILRSSSDGFVWEILRSGMVGFVWEILRSSSDGFVWEILRSGMVGFVWEILPSSSVEFVWEILGSSMVGFVWEISGSSMVGFVWEISGSSMLAVEVAGSAEVMKVGKNASRLSRLGTGVRSSWRHQSSRRSSARPTRRTSRIAGPRWSARVGLDEGALDLVGLDHPSALRPELGEVVGDGAGTAQPDRFKGIDLVGKFALLGGPATDVVGLQLGPAGEQPVAPGQRGPERGVCLRRFGGKFRGGPLGKLRLVNLPAIDGPERREVADPAFDPLVPVDPDHQERRLPGHPLFPEVGGLEGEISSQVGRPQSLDILGLDHRTQQRRDQLLAPCRAMSAERLDLVNHHRHNSISISQAKRSHRNHPVQALKGGKLKQSRTLYPLESLFSGWTKSPFCPKSPRISKYLRRIKPRSARFPWFAPLLATVSS